MWPFVLRIFCQSKPLVKKYPKKKIIPIKKKERLIEPSDGSIVEVFGKRSLKIKNSDIREIGHPIKTFNLESNFLFIT